MATAQAVEVIEDGTLAITLAGSDLDGDALTYAVTTPPAHGALAGTGPNLTYTPEANYHGSDSFAFTAHDSALASAPALVSITVTPVNDAPVAAAQAVEVLEDGTLAITLAGSDIDGDALSYTVTTPPMHGALAGTAPNLTYTPAANYHGSDGFAFTAHDSALASAPALVSINVSPLEEFTQWMNGFNLTANPETDADGDSISNAVEYVIGGNPVNHPDGALLPTVSMVTASPLGNRISMDYLLFTYRRTVMAKTDPDTVITVEWTTDLAGPWIDAKGSLGVLTIEENGAADVGVDLVNVYIPRSLSPTGKLFARLGVAIGRP